MSVGFSIVLGMDFERHLAELREHSATLISVVSEHDPRTKVTTCPRWTLQDLLGHAGGALRWATEMSSTAPGEKAAKPTAPPEDYREMLAWVNECREQALTTLTELGPDRPCRVFRGGEPSTPTFWARRMAHEWAIHRLDGDLATGAETHFAVDFAVDGVDEMLITMLNIMATNGRKPAAVQGKILFRATDSDRTWLVDIPEDAAPSVSAEADNDAELTITGTAADVYRAVWGRPHNAAVEGNTALLSAISSP